MTVEPRAGLARRLVTNTLHVASGRIAAVVVWLLFTPMILRALGPQTFGLWALFFAMTGQLASMDFGLVQGTIRHVAAARERGDHAEAGAFATLAVLGYVLIGLVWLAALWLLRDPICAWLRIPATELETARFGIALGAAVFTVSGFASVVMAVAQAYGRFDLANGITLALTAQHAIGIPIVLTRGWGLKGLMLNVGAGWCLGLILGLSLLGRAARGFHWGSPAQSLKHVKEAVRFGGPMQITAVLWTFGLQVDKFLLSRFVALAAVTPYELGARVAVAAFAFPQLLLIAAYPEAAAIHAAGNRERMRQLYHRAGHYVLTASAITAAALLASADRLYAVWFGPGHADSAFVVRGLGLAWAVLMTTGMGSVVARGIGRTDLEAWYHVAGLTVHLALSLWLLPVLGLPATVIALLAGNLAGAAMFVTLVGRVLRWSTREILLGPHVVPVLATIAGGLAGYAVDRAMPAGAGPLRWALLAIVVAVAAAGALATTLVTRYIAAEDARGIFTARVPHE